MGRREDDQRLRPVETAFSKIGRPRHGDPGSRPCRRSPAGAALPRIDRLRVAQAQQVPQGDRRAQPRPRREGPGDARLRRVPLDEGLSRRDAPAPRCAREPREDQGDDRRVRRTGCPGQHQSSVDRRRGDPAQERKELAEHAPDYLKHLLAADAAADPPRVGATLCPGHQGVRRHPARPLRSADPRARPWPTSPVEKPAPGADLPGPDPAARRELPVARRRLPGRGEGAQQVSNKVGPNATGVEAYKAAAPRWADYGRKMWKLAEENPRHPDAFEALLWIVGHPLFFDDDEERAATSARRSTP